MRGSGDGVNGCTQAHGLRLRDRAVKQSVNGHIKIIAYPGNSYIGRCAAVRHFS